MPRAPGLRDNTLRQVVRLTVAGQRLRVELSNEFGDAPLQLRNVYVAVFAGVGSSIVPETTRALSFAGRSSLTLSAGQRLWSDAVDFPTRALDRIAVSVEFGDVPGALTGHPGSRATSFIERGHTGRAESLSESSTEHWYVLSGVDVERNAKSRAIVTLGDSITDGRGSTTDENNRWPDALANRLARTPAGADIAVLNQGIGGNALVSGGIGPTALQRFERDVLDQDGVRWVIVLEGVNDIGAADDERVASALIDGYQRLIAAAHARELLIYGSPMLPFAGSQYESRANEAARQRVNHWVRTSGAFDAVIDFDAAVRDPATPDRLRSEYDCGDHLHLSVAGLQALADSVDLSLFA